MYLCTGFRKKAIKAYGVADRLNEAKKERDKRKEPKENYKESPTDQSTA
jgi:hypothetical protein